MDITRTVVARFAGRCAACQGAIAVGEKIARKERRGDPRAWASPWKHAACEVTWLVDGRTIAGSGGVALRVGINAEGQRVGDNAHSVLSGIAAYAPSGSARAAARQGMADLNIPF